MYTVQCTFVSTLLQKYTDTKADAIFLLFRNKYTMYIQFNILVGNLSEIFITNKVTILPTLSDNFPYRCRHFSTFSILLSEIT